MRIAKRRTPIDPSIAALRACAEKHLDHYTDRNGPRAFWTYDRLGDPDALTPLDCLAPALLSVRIDYHQVVPLFQEDCAGADVLKRLQAVLDVSAREPVDFLDLDLDDADGPWQHVDAALIACGEARGRGVPRLKAVAATKILHRKRPAFVPIFDREIYRFYFGRRPPIGAYKEAPRRLWPVLQADLRASRSWLEKLAATKRTPDDRPLSPLRAADIVIWEHAVTHCKASGD
ncbi:DUF6308 family protein [Geodermatophilus sp. SYSU D00758]